MKKTIAIVFAALSVATFGCNKSKTDTANPDEAKTETPAETPPRVRRPPRARRSRPRVPRPRVAKRLPPPRKPGLPPGDLSLLFHGPDWRFAGLAHASFCSVVSDPRRRFLL
ncbi:hypothetical protein [Nannocystis pusilla]|uniref:hypothetical protein n=1 Tax=Nannocystis pusilla TaxID=889268 RepID=UPI003B7720E7